MKKIFCDVCGNEMSYPNGSNPSIQHLFGKDSQVSVLGQGNNPLTFKLHIKLETDTDKPGQHIDICADCRLYLLSKLDPRSKTEQLNAIGVVE